MKPRGGGKKEMKGMKWIGQCSTEESIIDDVAQRNVERLT